MRSTTALALAASVSVSNAVYQGFNYAFDKPDGSIMQLADWTDAFNGQKELAGTDGKFTSARIYSMIKDPKQSPPQPILAFQAAQDVDDMTLLLGVWCSAGQSGVDAEITAMKAAMEQFPGLGSRIAGISVGSEDLYRVSNIANATNKANPDNQLGPGVFPDVLLSYVEQVKGNLTGSWANIPVGHVDTWTAFTNDDGSFNQDDLTKLIGALGFLGVDSYPYFQGTMPNDISASTDLFNEAYQRVLAVAGNAEVWITETGWPHAGDTINEATATVDNAETYWLGVGCANFGKINTWWYTFYDENPKASFGVSKSLTGGDTFYNLTCDGHTDSPDAAKAVVSSNASKAFESTANSTSSNNGTNGTSSGSTRTSSSGSAGSSPTAGSNKQGGGSQSGALAVTGSTVFVLLGAMGAAVAMW